MAYGWHGICLKTLVRTWLRIIYLFGLPFLLCLQTPAAQTPTCAAEFPFQFREGMIWLEVRSPKSGEPLNFLLDSGAGLGVINLSTAKRLGLHLAKPIQVQGVGSATTGYFPQRLTASIAGIAMPKQYVSVDLDDLSDACHCHVDGLIGADFFRDRVVQIDFAEKKVRILNPGTAFAADETLPLKKNRNAFLMPITVNGKEKQWVRVDTGCASGLHWVAKTAPADNPARRVAIALNEVPLDTLPTSITIGKMAFESVSADLHGKPVFRGEDGLLGNGILARFRSVTLDTVRGKIAFEFSHDGSERLIGPLHQP